tara:strand:+ start:19455 stop:19769 length:315 start_codon:yes stop_codon:yes gene_type:complete
MITITKNTIPIFKKMLENHKAIFFGAKSGGCSGFEYLIKPTNKIEKIDEVVDISGIPFAICGHSQFLIIGTKIDWKEDYMGQRFDFNNPLANGTCGCGATFSVS